MTFVPGLERVLPVALGAFVGAALVAFGLTPLVRSVAERAGLVDAPDPRRVHARPIPRGGGLAVAAAFVGVGALSLAVVPSIAGAVPAIRPVELVVLLGGVALAAVIGVLDDVRDLRARWQLLGQIALASAAVAMGVSIEAIGNPFGPGVIAFEPLFGAVFTVVWIVGMINSINFIDGLDGLSTGISLIAALTLGILSLTTVGNQPTVAVLCLALAGALLGFLRWNFHPASVFTGTAGVMATGFALAVLSTLGSAKVVVALLVLGVPIIDTFWVIVRRVLSGRSPFTPDRGHLHHHLLDLGLDHRATVLLIYAICIGLAALALVASAAAQVYAFLAALLGLGLTVLVLARPPRETLEPGTYEDDGAIG